MSMIVTQDEFEQIIAEAMERIGKEHVRECVVPFAMQYGFPIPAERYDGVIFAVATLVKKVETQNRKLKR